MSHSGRNTLADCNFHRLAHEYCCNVCVYKCVCVCILIREKKENIASISSCLLSVFTVWSFCLFLISHLVSMGIEMPSLENANTSKQILLPHQSPLGAKLLVSSFLSCLYF